MAGKGVAVITGGASGIGEATARRFARDGFDIAILDMNESAGEQLAAGLAKGGVRARFWRCDVSDLKAVEATAA